MAVQHDCRKIARSVEDTAPRTPVVYLQRPTEPLLHAQPARFAAPACATRARQFCTTAATPNRNEVAQQEQELHHTMAAHAWSQ